MSMEWKPIETAPKDGTWFLGYRAKTDLGQWDRVMPCLWGHEHSDFIAPAEIFDIYASDPYQRDADGFLRYDFYEMGRTLTHWMPLPEPPSSTATASADIA